MKRIFLALVLLTASGVGFVVSREAVNRARQELHASHADWLTLSQHLAQIEEQKGALDVQVRELRRALRSLDQNIPADSALTVLLTTNQPNRLLPEVRERLLAELGLSWHSSDGWIVVSKTTLASIEMDAVWGNKLTDAVCGALAVAPDERQRVEAAFARVREDFAAWAKAHVQREGPSDEMLVRYTIPCDPEFAQGLTNQLFGEITATLGAERAGLLERYLDGWLQIGTGYLGAVTNTLTVLHQSDRDGNTSLYYKLTRESDGRYGRRQAGPSKIIPKSFPPAFRQIFAGGWREVAQREGFDLPKEFQEEEKAR